MYEYDKNNQNYSTLRNSKHMPQSCCKEQKLPWF